MLRSSGRLLPAAAALQQQWAPAAGAAAAAAAAGPLGVSAAATAAGAAATTAQAPPPPAGAGAGALQLLRFFKTGVWDVRGQPRRKPGGDDAYFNPDDGPDAYFYWRDLWRSQKRPTPRRAKVPKRLPVFLEQEEQDALVAAAVGAGVPQEIVLGDMSKRLVPRLITAIQCSGGAIPTDPDALAARIRGLLEMEREVPGLDVMRIFKAHGFHVLYKPPKQVARLLRYLSTKLQEENVVAEPGLLLTAAPKPTLFYVKKAARRVAKLLEAFDSTLGVVPPNDRLLGHPCGATLLNRTPRAMQRYMQALSDRHGPEAAAQVVAKHPQLLHFRPSTLDHKTLALGEALALDATGARALVARCPKLLTHGVEALRARVAGLRQLLGLGTGPLARAVCRQPSLLHKSMDSLAAKLAKLQQLLGVTEDKTLDLVRRRPGLLCYASDSLAAAVGQAAAALERGGPALAPAASEVSGLFLAQPALLCLSADPEVAPRASLGARVTLLQDLASSGPAWASKVSALLGPDRDVTLLAQALAHRQLYPRLNWVLQRQREKAQQQQQPAAAAAAEEDGGGSSSSSSLLELLDAPASEFDPAYAAWRDERRAAGAAAAAQTQQRQEQQ